MPEVEARPKIALHDESTVIGLPVESYAGPAVFRRATSLDLPDRSRSRQDLLDLIGADDSDAVVVAEDDVLGCHPVAADARKVAIPGGAARSGTPTRMQASRISGVESCANPSDPRASNENGLRVMRRG
jgi:hypothetical protein